MTDSHSITKVNLNEPQNLPLKEIQEWNRFQQEIRFNRMIRKVCIAFVIAAVIVTLAVVARMMK